MAAKTVAIVQSCYIPWKGYFDLINRVDEFILYDDRQFTRRDWRSRNRIKTAQGVTWLSIPVAVKGRYHQRIDETQVADPEWAERHWKTLVHSYAAAPAFREYAPSIETLYEQASRERLLSRVNRCFIDGLCELLGIDTPRTLSTDYAASGERTARLVSLCKAAGATRYLSGPTARAYLDEAAFAEAGIEVEYADYTGYPEYEQLYPPFEHAVTILDLLFHVGTEAPRYLKSFSVQRDSVLRPVERYYTAKVTEHGAVPAGVDWNSNESQELRFLQLLKVVDVSQPFSINDVGCGYGALALLLDRLGCDATYSGFDISPAMISRARSDVGETPRRSFSSDEMSLEPADYSVASGIFNVKLEASDDEWQAYVLGTLDRMRALSRRGFAFNMLTSYSDPERKRDDLFYAEPGFFFDHCKRRYSRHVALLHDYGLWEFTVLVRTEPVE